MSGRYAEKTSVPVERSETEIKRVLQRYGAAKIGVMTEPTKATIYFQVKDRDVQLVIPLPQGGDPFPGKKGHTWTKSGAEGEQRRRWRVMVLTLKAMLEAVDSQITTFDQVFLAHVVMPGTGRTIGDLLVPKLPALCSGKTLPALLAENRE
jgi:hypothetical protein